MHKRRWTALSVSRFGPDFPKNRVPCLSAARIFCPVSVRNFEKNLFDVYLSGFFLSRFCPLSGFYPDDL